MEGDHTDVVFELGVTFGTVAGVGFAGTLSADLESVAGGGAAAGLLEHAAQTPRRIAIVKRLLIGGLTFLIGDGRDQDRQINGG